MLTGTWERWKRFCRKIKDEGCQLAVLPEMWSGGFDYAALREMAERTPAILEKLKEWAEEYRMVLVGSLPEAEGDKIFNTSYVIDANGEVAGKYRKIHLFSLTGEPDHFERGRTPVVCETGLGRLGIEICYDLRFPELSRAGAGGGGNPLLFGPLAGAQDRPLVPVAAQPRRRKSAFCHGLQRLRHGRQYPVRRGICDCFADREAARGSRQREEVIIARLNPAEMQGFSSAHSLFLGSFARESINIV